jgi:hypothetical protein
MIFTDESLIDNIEQMFPIPCYGFITRGLRDGIILRFKTFYLKIYDEDKSYNIQGYRYNEDASVFNIIIHENQFRDFCLKFRKEDYLMNIKTI